MASSTLYHNHHRSRDDISEDVTAATDAETTTATADEYQKKPAATAAQLVRRTAAREGILATVLSLVMMGLMAALLLPHLTWFRTEAECRETQSPLPPLSDYGNGTAEDASKTTTSAEVHAPTPKMFEVSEPWLKGESVSDLLTSNINITAIALQYYCNITAISLQ